VYATTVTDKLPTVGLHHRAAPLVATILVAVGLVVPANPVAGRTPEPPLERVRDVRLPGRSSRFDYQSADAPGRRLYVAHLGDSALDVIDLDTLRVVGTVPGLANVHGVLAVPEIGRVFASATGTNELVTLDASTDQVAARTPTGTFPDGVGYDPRDDLVLVSNKNAGSETVIEGRSGRVVRAVQLGREVGNVAYDPSSGLAYVSVRPPDQVVAVDPTTGAITDRVRLKDCRGAHGLYLQTETQQAFVACENNAKVVMVDLRNHRQIAAASVGDNPDVLAYDPGLGRLYVAAESGVVTVFSPNGDRLHKLGQTHLADKAHSVAVDPTTHLVFFPLERDPDKPGLRVMKPVRTAGGVGVETRAAGQ
jgi:DNA-binding beta-propeller fold protein YncE